jgi:glucose/arabinose dehydrogenase
MEVDMVRRGAKLMVRGGLAAAVVLGTLSLTGTSSAGPTPFEAARRLAVPLDELGVTTTLLAEGLQRPTVIAAPDDGSDRLLIAEKVGRVRVYQPDTGLAGTPLLDITDRVSVSGNERGLLGVVTSPSFATTLSLYVAYTALPSGALTLSRFRLDTADQASVPADAEEVLLTQPHAQFSNHNGGQLVFGPDGYLYWSLGDGGGANDTLRTGQNLGTLLGKILRLDVSSSCAGLAYCVPQDNPFVGQDGARPEIWAYGLRNPWRFSFDPADGALWIADVGQGTQEEIDYLAPGTAGANLGWSCREGTVQRNADQCSPAASLVEPVFTYRSGVDGCAVIGGFVYRGAQFAELADGTYLNTDYCSATAWATRPPEDGTGFVSQPIGELPAQPTSLGVDARGELYLVNDSAGQLYRVGFVQRDPA